MGLFGLTHGEWETLIASSEGDEAAKRKSLAMVENTYKISKLKKIAKTTHYLEVSTAADERIWEIQTTPKRILKEQQKKMREKREEQRAQKEAFAKAAEDINRPEYWLKRMYEWYPDENETGRSQIENALLGFGEEVYPKVKEYVFALAMLLKQDGDRLSQMKGLTYDENRMYTAMFESYESGLSYGVQFLAKFKNENRVKDISDLYDYVYTNIYSDPNGGFSDTFHAVRIRQKIVWAMERASASHLETREFYSKMLQDESVFVRWEAMDVLEKQWTPEEVQSDGMLKDALEKAYKKEPGTVGNRRKICKKLLGK
ncbi:MAG: hypothetical protein HUJ58_00905 [Erysipelotrichaceae bacterium]|nr:hypothetical protein [Erysipelotrichaceae bacterium]